MNYDFSVRIGEFQECRHYDSAAFHSDMWRLQILQQYGGIYFDLDIVFLKDVSWFANYGAIVHEGYTAEKVFNNAIMYFPAGHSGLQHWLDLIGKDGRLGWNRIFEIQRISNEFGADMLPNSVSDRGWTTLGPGCDDFFDAVGLSPDMMGESFMYHWHNRWSKSVRKPGTLAAFYWRKFVEDNDAVEIATATAAATAAGDGSNTN